MKVELIAHTPEPDKVCAASAFITWKKKTAAELFSELSDKEADDFLRVVMNLGHVSVTEHAVFTFSISGVSRALTHQLVRHRMASYCQQSQRYVKFGEDEIEVVIPPKIEEDEKSKEIYLKAIQNAKEGYIKLLENGIAPEDARFLLPNAATTNIIVTMNARELNHFFSVRACERTQWELREVATEMVRLVKKKAPVLFENAGPNCMKGPCPEKNLSCGKMEEVRKKFREL